MYAKSPGEILRDGLRSCQQPSKVHEIVAATGRAHLLGLDSHGQSALDFARKLRLPPASVQTVANYVGAELETRKQEEADVRASSFVGRFLAANRAAGTELQQALESATAVAIKKALVSVQKHRPPERIEFDTLVARGEPSTQRFDAALRMHQGSHHRASVSAVLTPAAHRIGSRRPASAVELRSLIATPLSRAKTALISKAQRTSSTVSHSKGAVDSVRYWTDIRSSSSGLNALAIAVRESDLALVEQLLRLGASPNSLCGTRSDAVCIAAASGNIMSLKAMLVLGSADLGHKLLLEGAASVDDLLRKPLGSFSTATALPLVDAARAGQAKTVELLTQTVRAAAVGVTITDTAARAHFGTRPHWSTRVLHWLHARDYSGQSALEVASSAECLRALLLFEKRLMAAASRNSNDKSGKQAIRCGKCGMRMRREEQGRHDTFLCSYATHRDIPYTGMPRHQKLPGLSFEQRLQRVRRPSLYHTSIPCREIPKYKALPDLELPICLSTHVEEVMALARCSSGDQIHPVGTTGIGFSSAEIETGGKMRDCDTPLDVRQFLRTCKGRTLSDGSMLGRALLAAETPAQFKQSNFQLQELLTGPTELPESFQHESGQAQKGGNAASLGTSDATEVPCPLRCGMLLPVKTVGKHILDRCSRRALRCPDGCGEKLEARTLHVHTATCSHRVVTCGCGWVVRQCDLPNHLRNECPRAEIACPNACGLVIRRSMLGEHRHGSCARRVVVCTSGCSQLVVASRIDDHLNLHCPTRMLPCPNDCGSMIQRQDLDDHSLLCSEAARPCVRGCGQVVLRGDQSMHDMSCNSFHQPCPLGCGASMARGLFDEHARTSCPHRIVQCKLNCGTEVRFADLTSHEESDCPKQLVRCQACQERLLRHQLDGHRISRTGRQLDCGHGGIACRRSLSSWLANPGHKSAPPRLHRCVHHASTPLANEHVLNEPALLLSLIRLVDQAELSLEHGLGKTPLVRAAELGLVAAIRILVDAGADPDQETSTARWPLAAAAEASHLSAVSALVSVGASIAHISRIRRRAIDYAMRGSECHSFLQNQHSLDAQLARMFRLLACNDATGLCRELGDKSLGRWLSAVDRRVKDLEDTEVANGSTDGFPSALSRFEMLAVLESVQKRAFAGNFSTNEALRAAILDRENQAEVLKKQGLQLLCSAIKKRFSTREQCGIGAVPVPNGSAMGRTVTLIARPPSLRLLKRSLQTTMAKLAAVFDGIDNARRAMEGGKLIHTINGCGHTLLSYAASIGSVRCLAVLLKAGRSAGTPMQCFQAGATLIQSHWRVSRSLKKYATHVSHGSGKDSLMQALELKLGNGLKVKRAHKAWRLAMAAQPLPLHQAVYSGHVHCAMLLVRFGAPVDLRSHGLPIASMPYSSEGELDNLSIRLRVPVLERDGILSEKDDPSSEFYEEDLGKSPVSRKGNSKLLSRSVSLEETAFAGCVHLGTRSFRPGIGWSTRDKHVECLDMSMQLLNGSLKQRRRIQDEWRRHRTARSQAAIRSRTEAEMDEYAKAGDIQGVLSCLRRGANPAAEIRGGFNAICIAASSALMIADPSTGIPKSACRLIADTYAQSPAALPASACSLGVSPIHVASFFGRADVILELVSDCRVPTDVRAAAPATAYFDRANCVFQVHHEGVQGMTAVAFSCVSGQASALEMLLKLGASTTDVNAAGESAEAVAARHGSLRCLKLLRQIMDGKSIQKESATILSSASSEFEQPEGPVGALGISHQGVRCKCGVYVMSIEEQAHSSVCPAALVACRLCGTEIIRSEEVHHVSEQCSMRMCRCPKGCRAAVRAHELERHLKQKQCIR